MIKSISTIKDLLSQRLVLIVTITLVNIAGFLYAANYLNSNGYLPSPFIYDKSDTFMDLFNPMYWAYDDGRYTEWGSVYPPLSFLILKILNTIFSGSGLGDPFYIRENSPMVIVGFCLIYLLLPAALLMTKYWHAFTRNEKFILYFAMIFSAPMLFALERGNMIILCPILLGLVLSRIGIARSLSIALLVNIKPYFALLLLYYVARKNWRGFAGCVLLSGLIFMITGLVLDDNYIMFVSNLFNFYQNDAVFSLREVMALPSSISAFSYVINNPDGATFVSSVLSANWLIITIFLIEAAKWGAVAVALVTLWTKSVLIRDIEILALLVIIISNLGIWVGGYSLIFYAALLPIFASMRARVLYVSAVALIAMPLDVVALRSDFIGMQYSYLAGYKIDINWTLGVGSLIRPILNLGLLLVLSLELLNRRLNWQAVMHYSIKPVFWNRSCQMDKQIC